MEVDIFTTVIIYSEDSFLFSREKEASLFVQRYETKVFRFRYV